MRIKHISQETNLPAKTIRYYEEIGLLLPSRRFGNGYRDYDKEALDRVRFVAGARSLDFSLDDVRDILALRERREASCRVVLAMLEERANEINRRIAEMQRIEDELRKLYRLGQTFSTDDVDGKNCLCHLVSMRSESVTN